MEVISTSRSKLFKINPNLQKFLSRIFEDNLRAIIMGDFTEQDAINEVKKKFDVDIPESYLSAAWLGK